MIDKIARPLITDIWRLVERRLPFLSGESARYGMQLVGGTALGQAFVVLVTPILTRLYSPAEFGVLGIFVAYLNSAAVLASLRYETAIPNADDKDAANLLALALGIAVALSFVAGGVLVAMKVTSFMSYGLISTWMCVAAIPAIFCSSAIESLRYWLIRARRFGDVSRILIRQGAGKALIPLALGGTRFAPAGLVIGEVVGRLVGVARPLRTAIPVARSAEIIGSAQRFRAVVGKYWKLPAIYTPSSLVDVFSMSLPIVLIADLYGPARAGLFLLVQRVITLPTSLIGASVADVFHVRLSELVPLGRPTMRRLVRSTARRLLLLGMAFIVPLAVISPFLASPVLGRSWQEAGELLTILAPWSLAGLVVSPLSRVLTVTLDLQLKLIYDVTALLLLFVAIWIAKTAELNFFGGMVAISLLRVVAYIVYYCVILAALRDKPTENALAQGT